MTKTLSRILILLLCLCMPLTAFARGVDQNLYVYADYAEPDARSVASIAGAGDTLYLLTNDASTPGEARLERWQPGMAQPETALEGLSRLYDQSDATEERVVVHRLLSDGSAVYGLDTDAYALTRLVDETGAPAVTPVCTLERPVQTEENADGWVELMQVQLIDGAVTLCFVQYNNTELPAFALEQYDLHSGKQLRTLTLEGMSSYLASPYRDGLLLYLCQPPYDEQLEEFPNAQLMTLDPKTGQTTLLREDVSASNISLLAYDAGTDTACYVKGATVYSLPLSGGEARVSAYLPTETWWVQSEYALFADGALGVMTNGRVYVRALDGDGMASGPITIYGESGGQRYYRVVSEHPELPVTMANEYYNGLEQLTTAMVSGDSTVDVMLLNMAYNPVQRMIQKGYAADLTAYPAIAEVLDRMDPLFLEPVSKDGKVYALPAYISAYTIGVDTKVMETLGLTMDDLPATWLEWLDFAANFQYDYGEAHPEVVLLDELEMRRALFSTIQKQYIASQMRQRQTVQFDTPLFRKLMEALMSVDFSELDPYAARGAVVWEDGTVDEFYEKESLFLTHCQLSPESLTTGTNAPLPLTLDADVEPVIPVPMEVMLLNPRSQHLDMAASFLAAYAQTYDATEEAIMLFPDSNEAVANRYYEVEKQAHEYAIRDYQARIDKADESEKATLREELAWWEQDLANLENQRISVSAEAIARYRTAYAPYLFITTQTPLTDWSGSASEELETLQAQYQDGAITLDTYIRETDKRVKMMMLEDR